jgi:GxxExxY protein
MDINDVSGEVISAAMRVHTELGPGLLESAYEGCLAFELTYRKVSIQRQMVFPVHYRGQLIDVGYRLDLLVADQLIVEVKAVDKLLPIHSAQLLSYLRLSDKRVGLLLNFNVSQMRDGIRRMVNDL